MMRAVARTVDETGVRALPVTRAVAGGASVAERDQVVVEAPLEFRVDGQPGAVTMRTPGHDRELVTGLLFSEGLVAAAGDVRGFEELADGVVNVKLAPALVRKRMPDRSMYASSSCGVCGKVSLDAIAVKAVRVDAALAVAADVIASLPDRLRAAQAMFDATGGLHAAGAFTAGGDLLCAREDVGRHNAVDKVLGWALAAGRLPLSDAVLQVSGRLSYEILQKAAVAGFPVVSAVSAPSTMAVDVAERFGITLCGFVRGGAFNIYTHPARIVASADAQH